MITIPNVLIAGEAEEMIRNAAAGCGDMDLSGIVRHKEILADAGSASHPSFVSLACRRKRSDNPAASSNHPTNRRFGAQTHSPHNDHWVASVLFGNRPERRFSQLINSFVQPLVNCCLETLKDICSEKIDGCPTKQQGQDQAQCDSPKRLHEADRLCQRAEGLRRRSRRAAGMRRFGRALEHAVADDRRGED